MYLKSTQNRAHRPLNLVISDVTNNKNISVNISVNEFQTFQNISNFSNN